MNSSKSVHFNDSCIVYNYQNAAHYGTIQKMFYGEPSKKFILKIRPMMNTNFDTLSFASRTFINEHVIYGTFSAQTIHLIAPEAIVEKACLYENDDLTFIARYPNLYESS